MVYEYVTKTKFVKTPLQKKAEIEAIMITEYGLKIPEHGIFLTIAAKVRDNKDWVNIEELSKEVRAAREYAQSLILINQNILCKIK